jgi:hypothetical protein
LSFTRVEPAVRLIGALRIESRRQVLGLDLLRGRGDLAGLGRAAEQGAEVGEA